jgi:hypothetical protein
VDNIKMDLVKIGLCCENCFGLAQVRYRWRALVNAIMNFKFCKMLGKRSSGYTTDGRLTSAQLHSLSPT